MSNNHTGNVQPSVDREEHEHTVEPATKRVLVYGYDGSTKQIVKTDSSGNTITLSGLSLKPYDYVSRTINSATETWTFKTGGAGGTTTNTVVIVYTDTSLETISTVTKT